MISFDRLCDDRLVCVAVCVVVEGLLTCNLLLLPPPPLTTLLSLKQPPSYVSPPFTRDRDRWGGRILLYVRDDIPCKEIKVNTFPSDIECLLIHHTREDEH